MNQASTINNQVNFEPLFTENINNFCDLEQKAFDIHQQQIQQIEEEASIGINKKITKITIDNHTKKPIEVTQSYFSGLVYRLDSRPINEIINSGGFYPTNKRHCDDSLLAKNVCFTDKYQYNQEEITIFRVYSGDEQGIISTSKNFTGFNVGYNEWLNHFKYVIDVCVDYNYGLDIDETMQLSKQNKRFEVVFEQPIKKECIVGYFKGLKHNNTFYPNDLYKGDFSWHVDNVVVNYQQKNLLSSMQ